MQDDDADIDGRDRYRYHRRHQDRNQNAWRSEVLLKKSVSLSKFPAGLIQPQETLCAIANPPVDSAFLQKNGNSTRGRRLRVPRIPESSEYPIQLQPFSWQLKRRLIMTPELGPSRVKERAGKFAIKHHVANQATTRP
jgi:hypothetical protein